MHEITIPLQSHDEAILVLGPYDRYAKLLRQALDIEIFTRNGNLRIQGADDAVNEARRRIDHLLGKARKGRSLDVRAIEEILLGPVQEGAAPVSGGMPVAHARAAESPSSAGFRPSTRPFASAALRGPRVERHMRVRPVEPRSENQRRYMELMEKLDLVFGIGVAGTGKTYLAVAAAVAALRRGTIRKLVITRPVVEAGERLGFLPGDVQAKLNPYMRPIYDALQHQLDFEDVGRLEEAGVIEIAPLAFMRGRTLSSAFIILDEGQNASVGQMQMFLTRLGEGSRMVVTGDPSQNDLVEGKRSGLLDAVQRLRSLREVGIVEFGTQDVIRHHLVEKIVRAYDSSAKKSEPRPER